VVVLIFDHLRAESPAWPGSRMAGGGGVTDRQARHARSRDPLRTCKRVLHRLRAQSASYPTYREGISASADQWAKPHPGGHL